VLGPEELEVGARGERARREVHHLLVAQVGVGHHHRVDALLAHDPLELGLAEDRQALGVELARELRRVATALDAGICVAVKPTTSYSLRVR